MNNNRIKIKNVLIGSLAEEVGIESGDILVSINNNRIKDIFDYKFLITFEKIIVCIEKINGDTWEIEIEKDEYEDLGLEFDDELINGAKSCVNKCLFCFIDQLPKGMRDTLYFKDDDSRMSFLSGNYITLTNMNEEDIERIIKYRMSPVNISVHTTNPELRVKMLNNKNAGTVLKYINMLVDNGIKVNTQIVLCRGINDRVELDKTITDLSKLYPRVHSISVVPVGITKYRDENRLCKLEPFDKISSEEIITQVEKHQKIYRKKTGSNIVYLADEFYLTANKKIPSYKHYEDFPQIENGVGLIAEFNNDFDSYLAKIKSPIDFKKYICIATGTAAYEFIKGCVDKIIEKFAYANIKVFSINNNFFGEKVTVAGLVTGQDIIEQLKGKELGDVLLVPSTMLRYGEDVFLDDFTTSDLEKELNIKVRAVHPKAYDFIDNVLGLN